MDWLTAIADIVGIGSGIRGLSGGGGSRVPGYNPGDINAANDNWNNFMRQWGLQLGSSLPGIMQAFGQSATDLAGLDRSGINQAAGAVGSQYGNLATEFAGLGNMLAQMGMQNVGGQGALQQAGNQLWQTAQDPQGALQQRMQQQIQDQSRASSTARGLGMSPVGAGMENQAMSNFLIDWQNQQLGRQAQGLQGMSQAYGQGANLGNLAGRDITSGMGALEQVPGFTQSSAMVPFNMQAFAAGWPGQVASQYGTQLQQQVYGPEQNFMNQLANYLGMGQGAQQQQWGQNQTNLSNIIGGLGSLAGLFGGNQFIQPGQPMANISLGGQFNQPLDPVQAQYGGGGGY